MVMQNDTPPTPEIKSLTQLAVEVQIGDGANARIALIPCRDAADSLAIQKLINKTPGKYIFGADTENPMTIHCGRVVFMQTVILPSKTQAPPLARLAKLSQ